MRGASRASLAQATDQLSDVLGRPRTNAGRLGDELLSVAGLLDREAGLRRTLSDPSRNGGAKAELARSLLSGKVLAATLDTVTGLASSRWSAPRDLADATEQLGALAVVAQADSEGELDELEDELFRFGRIVAGEPALRVALSSPYVEADRKRSLLATLLDGKVTAASKRLITQAALQPRGRSLDASLEDYAGIAARRRERLVAEVHVATELSAAQRSRLAGALRGLYGHDVHLNVVLDLQVVGGMSVRVGDEVIDGSIATRMAALRRKLAA
jgi:F-type H+-transporting ATPase subunit delta